MAETTWTLQDAKNQFSRVVAAAEKGRPQFVSKRGRSAVVVLSVEEYRRLAAASSEPAKNFVEHLLSIPKRPPSIRTMRSSFRASRSGSVNSSSRNRMFLLDTVVIFEETKRMPHEAATTWLRRTEPEQLFLSVASVAEIKRGISRQKLLDRHFAERLEDWLRMTERRFAERLLAVDAAIARLWGELWDQLGFNSPDLIIAATAQHHDLVVVTRNRRHFDNTGVRVLDPYQRIN